MKLRLSQLDKTFWHNLCYHWNIVLSFDLANVAWGMDYAQIFFMKLRPDQFHKTFFGIIYAAIGILA